MLHFSSILRTSVALLWCVVIHNTAIGASSAASEYSDQDTVLVQHNNSKASFFNPDYPDSALHYGKEALNIAVDIDYAKGICQSLRAIGESHMARLDFEEALMVFYRGLKIAEQNHLDLERAKLYIQISAVEKAEEQYNRALDIGNKALKIYQNLKYSDDLATLYNTMGDCYYKMQQYYRALEHFEMAYELVKRYPETLAMDIILYNIGKSYFALNNYEKALIYLREVPEMKARGRHSKVTRGHVLNTMGAIFLNDDDLEGAENLFNKALIIALQKNDLQLQIETHENLINLAFRRKNSESIFQNHRIYKNLTDSLRRTVQMQRVAELKIKYQTQIQQAEIKELSQTRRTQHYVLIGIALIVILLIIIFLQVVRHFKSKQSLAESTIERYRIEQDKLKKEIEAKYTEREAVMSQLEAAKHEHDKLIVLLRTTSEEKKEIRHELEKNNSKILDLEKQLDDRNEEYESEQLFFSLKSQLDMLIQDGSKTSKGELKRIRELIGNLIVEHKNKDFFRKLKEVFPKLSNEDLRLCAFMRNHFSNAEIAEFLEITQDTLYTRKHRLKRKLALDKDIDITEFLLDFDEMQIL